jgi:AcrR family transcriptional regulator
MGKRVEQKEKRRQEILVVGLDLFIRKGFAAAKISDIAKEVGMSVGLLFHYFESKEKLYEELIKIGMSGPEMIMSFNKSDALHFFQTAAKQILQFAVEDPFVAKMFLLISQAEYSDAAPESVKKMLQQNDSYEQSVLLIKKGQEEGTIRQGNPIALAVAYWAAIQGVCASLALDPHIPCPESEWIIDIIRRK